MSDDIILCSIEGCNNQKMSLVNTCPIHTSNDEITSKLKNLNKKSNRVAKNLTFYEINIASLVFENLTFENLTINEAELDKIVFKNCELELSLFFNCRFYNCQFIDCNFINTDFEESVFQDLIFTNISLSEANMHGNNFVGGTKFSHVQIDTSEIKNVQFLKANFSNDVSIINSSLIGTKIRHSNLDNIQISDTHFVNIDLFNTSLRLSNFIDIDIKLDENRHPTLCDFYKASFSDKKLYEEIISKNWNNSVYNSKKDFYYDVIKSICNKSSLSFFDILINAIKNYGKISKYDIPLIQLVHESFMNCWQKIIQKTNPLKEASLFFRFVDRLPKEFRQEEKLLLENKVPFIEKNKAILKLSFDIERRNNEYYGKGLSLNKIVLVNADLLRIKELIGDNDLEVLEIKKGSLEEWLSGNLNTIITIGLAFYTFSKGFKIFVNGITDSFSSLVDAKHKSKEKKEEIKGKELDNRKKELEIENLELEMQKKKSESINDMKTRYSYVPPKEQVLNETEKIANTISNHFHINSVEIHINQEAKD